MEPARRASLDFERLAGRQSLMLFLDAMSSLYLRFNRRFPRDVRNSALQGADFVDEVILEEGGEVRILEQLGLCKKHFDSLVEDLVMTGELDDGRVISAVEKTAIFLNMLRLNLSNRAAQERFQHSGATISHIFRAVVDAFAKLRAIWIKPPSGLLHPSISATARRFPWFKHCVGAIDGTHVQVGNCSAFAFPL